LTHKSQEISGKRLPTQSGAESKLAATKTPADADFDSSYQDEMPTQVTANSPASQPVCLSTHQSPPPLPPKPLFTSNPSNICLLSFESSNLSKAFEFRLEIVSRNNTKTKLRDVIDATESLSYLKSAFWRFSSLLYFSLFLFLYFHFV
jgi:hypothetical protein